jgi:hypothetical protein
MYNGSITANAVTPSVNMKNRLINSAMVIDQRNAGASVGTPNGYTLDRWQVLQSVTGKISTQQNQGSVTPPAGFANYLGITSLSAYSVLSSDYYLLLQNIEGFNVADLDWGTANAKTITMSFWVRSSLTGTFGGALTNQSNRSYPFTYTISASNTWEYKTITISGDTTGTWNKTNSTGLQVILGLGAGATYSGTAGAWSGSYVFSATGATSVVGTNGATFYITGVQLEVGSTATSFDYRPYGTELSLCYRYFQRMFSPTAYGYPSNSFTQATSATDSYGVLQYWQVMRAAPTLNVVSNFSLSDQGTLTAITSLSLDAARTGTMTGEFRAQTASGLTTNRIYNIINNNNTTASLNLSAEL